MSYIGKIPANAVLTTADLADGIVTAAKIEDGTVVAAEIASNAVTTAKINADAVTAAKIADDAINSEHYTDGSIDTAHIADVNVTQGKIADQAVNEAKMQISNAPTNGYMLTAQSGNTGGLTWAEAGGGSWVKISTVTASSSATVDFDNVSSGYSVYAVIGTGITPATANILFQMNFGTDGSTYAANKTSIYYTAYNNTGDSDSALEKVAGYSLGNATANQTLAAGVNANTTVAEGITMSAFFGGLNQTGYGSYSVTTNQFGHNSYIQQTVAAGQVMANVDCIRFIFSSGNIAAGKFTLYGIDQ